MAAPIGFIATVPLFSTLDDHELPQLAGSFVRSRFAQGATIFYQGEPGQTLFLIESGQVRIYVVGEDGQEQSMVLCGPREIFGELAVIDDRPRSASAVALEPTVVWALGREQFREQMQRSPRLMLGFLQLLSERLRYTTQQFNSLAFLSVSARLARKLLELTEDHGVPDADGVRLAAGLTQSDLASLIGTSRESINKTLRSFQRERLILLRQGQITIINPDGLYQVGHRG